MGVEIEAVNVPDHVVESCPARGMGVEIGADEMYTGRMVVMPREGHGSRNSFVMLVFL